MPRKKTGLNKPKASKEKRETGHRALARALTVREIATLRRAIFDVETRHRSRIAFQRIAKKYGVTSGDLEVAINIRLGKRIHRKSPTVRG